MTKPKYFKQSALRNLPYSSTSIPFRGTFNCSLCQASPVNTGSETFTDSVTANWRAIDLGHCRAYLCTVCQPLNNNDHDAWHSVYKRLGLLLSIYSNQKNFIIWACDPTNPNGYYKLVEDLKDEREH